MLIQEMISVSSRKDNVSKPTPPESSVVFSKRIWWWLLSIIVITPNLPWSTHGEDSPKRTLFLKLLISVSFQKSGN
jgi:hypothetical protein